MCQRPIEPKADCQLAHDDHERRPERSISRAATSHRYIFRPTHSRFYYRSIALSLASVLSWSILINLCVAVLLNSGITSLFLNVNQSELDVYDKPRALFFVGAEAAHVLEGHRESVDDLDYLIHLSRPQVSRHVRRLSSRRRRSLKFLINNTDDDTLAVDSNDDAPHNRVEIKLMSFNQTFILHLNPIKTSEFLSPSIAFIDKANMYASESQGQNASSSRDGAKSDCFYTGHVNNDTKSLAYINLCHEGHVLGNFKLNHRNYFIEPYEDAHHDELLVHSEAARDPDLMRDEMRTFIINGSLHQSEIRQLETHIIFIAPSDAHAKPKDEPELTHLNLEQSSDRRSSCELLGVNEFQKKLDKIRLDDFSKRKSSSHDNNSKTTPSKEGAEHHANRRSRLDELNGRLEKEYEKSRRRRARRDSSSSSGHAGSWFEGVSGSGPTPEQPYIIDRHVYLELMVVVDKEMEDYYGANLENHVLTIMFMATQMYQHPSIINPVRVFITDLVYLGRLKEHDLENLDIIWDAEKTLNSFCTWQSYYRSKTRNPAMVDAAILITKHDICKSKDVCQTLGMARLGQVCVPGHHCAVIEDSGINTAFTISHEIGHLVGMTHVDENKCHNLDVFSTQMMAPMLDLTKSSYEWSNCSVIELNNFLRTEDAFCLFNPPIMNPSYQNKSLKFDDIREQFDDALKKKAIFPGEMYDLSQQCKHIFGPESDACPQNLDYDCKVLWCKADALDAADSESHCVTTNTKWADGTPCGQNELSYFYLPKICMNGECVPMHSEKVQPVDGGWTEWSAFSRCSRTCGGGVRKRVRTCDNPRPRNGGRYCEGERVEYESCETQSCLKDEKDFRDMQCELAALKALEKNSLRLSDFEGVTSKSWKAYYSQDPKKKCKLTCKPSDRSNFAVLGAKVMDGTKCSPESFDICVNGICMPGGCDNILYSKKTMDNCGICGGDGSTCTQVYNRIETPNSYGYNDLFDIPPGAANVLVRRYRNSEDIGCLALRTSRVFLLNGYYVISKMNTSIEFEGIRIDYLLSTYEETIKTAGKFSQPIRLQFLAGDVRGRSQNGLIEFSYYIPNEKALQSRNKNTHYRKTHSEDSTHHHARDHHQNEADKTPRKVAQRLSSDGSGGHGKEYKWVYPEHLKSPMTSCSKLCNGIMRIKVIGVCMSGQRPVDEHLCTGEKSSFIDKPCNTDCRLQTMTTRVRCVAKKGSCGPGEETPQFVCLKIETNGQRSVVDLSNCDQTEIRDMNSSYAKKCHIACDDFKWKVQESPCSVKCGDGVKYRSYECFDGNANQFTNASYCAGMNKPKSEQIPCSMPCYKLQASEWSQCSATCGGGYRTRTVYCVFVQEKRVVDSSLCDQDPALADNEPCNSHECPVWVVGAWSACSVPCEQSQRRRSVVCMYKGMRVESQLCHYTYKPHDVEECLQENCAVWKTSAWSKCSATCGAGFQTRLVYCEYENYNSGPASMSNNHIDSYTIYKYRRLGSNHYLEDPNSRQLTTSVQNNVNIFSNRVDDSLCDESKRPANSTPCYKDRVCAEWKTGEWSTCSVGCGNGTRTREVYCSDANETNCRTEPRPAGEETCVMPECIAHWQVGNWSKCYGNCKNGWKSRPVICVDKLGNILSQQHCNYEKKPTNRQKCTDNCGYWRLGEWSECSAKCGEGFQSRTVECYSESLNEPISSSYCDLSSKPVENQICDSKCDLKTYDWKILGKEGCSVTCGHGWQYRIIECQFEDGTPSDLCKEDDRPDYYEQCDAGECPTWQYGSWSACPASCGEGIQRRLIVCRLSNGTILDDSFCKHIENEKPEDSMKCYGHSCASWIASNWSECNPKTCTMIRKVQCSFENGTIVAEYNCKESEKPTYVSECTNRLKCDVYVRALMATTPVTTTELSSTTTLASTTTPVEPSTRKPIFRILAAAVAKPTTPGLEMGELHYTNWSKCSTMCGEGYRTRDIVCKSRESQKKLPLTSCNRDHVEELMIKCNLADCNYNLAEKWSKCNATCDKSGVELLDQKCYEKVTRKFVALQLCNPPANATKARQCFKHCDSAVANNFVWKVKKWNKCSGNCGLANKTRVVYCFNKQEQKIVTESLCVAKDKPALTQPCMITDCGYGWTVSGWSKCSKKCSEGVKRREVKCMKFSKDGLVLNESSNSCKLAEKPADEIICNLGDCDSEFHWKVGEWSNCSTNCGFGYQTRLVQCVNQSNRIESDFSKCSDWTPINSQICYSKCYPSSCSELKTSHGVDTDGEYSMNITNKIVSIYCKNMNTSKPSEYLTLKSGDSQNYAEVYDKKLIQADRCRFAPRYDAYCPHCKNETVENHGITLFSKVRIDIETLKIIENDFTFAKITYGSGIPYGTAGDCFSSEANCQQGRLNINLRGTKFVLSEETKWISYGEISQKNIQFSKDNSIVYGTCGGLCGYCKPDPKIGLKLRIVV